MTVQKAKKRAVRARMSKTGERYTAARRNLSSVPDPSEVDLGHSEASVRKGTGHGWRHWLRLLDAWGATKKTHKQIAQHLREEQGVSGWWSQAVTMGYERARGMRAVNQSAAGVFYVSVSKTVNVPVKDLFRAFVDAGARRRWLEPGLLSRRTASEYRSARFDFRDDGSRVVAGFESKEPSKSMVAVQHERLKDGKAVEEMRAFWRERLARL
ncbi:MAG TPA: hypothetical protein VEA19_01065, partial [Actinomycetota bacterium]|nr:hypothetical protein [Actinomycetota bacterium]